MIRRRLLGLRGSWFPSPLTRTEAKIRDNPLFEDPTEQREFLVGSTPKQVVHRDHRWARPELRYQSRVARCYEVVDIRLETSDVRREAARSSSSKLTPERGRRSGA